MAWIAHYAVARCLSVRVSVTRRYCVETVKHIVKLFSPSGSHTILVFFHTKRYGNIPTETPLTWGTSAGDMKKSRFSTCNSLFIGNDTRYGHSYYGMRRGNPTQAFEWYDSQWPWTTLSQISRSRHYLTLNITEAAVEIDTYYLQWNTNRACK